MGETHQAPQPPPRGTWAKLRTLRNRIWRKIRKLLFRRRKERPRWTETVKIPECPEGWSTGPPDFVGIGAQRSGTSWWYAGIEAQPQVVRVPKRRKELHYFNRFWTGEVPADVAGTYHRLFPRPAGSLAGEWTPRYMYDFWSVPLLREAAPETRLLVLLRDPVERYRSGLAFAVNRARRSGSPARLAQVGDAVARGLYADQLRHVFRFFPREQVLVLQFESCQLDPLRELQRTCEYLGIASPDELPEEMTREREPQEKPPLTDSMRAELVERLSPDVQSLTELCPEIDVSLWPNFAHLDGSDAAARLAP
jgi:hypothetical protein